MGRVGKGVKVAEVEAVVGCVEGRCMFVKEAMSWSAASMVDVRWSMKTISGANLLFVVERGGADFG